MILVIDNYDSFVHNLARYIRLLGFETEVVRNDAIDSKTVAERNPAAIVLSPGPCTPDEAGCSMELVKRFGQQTPILGICLGHQAIVQAYGGKIVRAPQPMHGRARPIFHEQQSIFRGLPSPIDVGRYHSLVSERSTLPGCLEVIARTDDGVVMAVQHRSDPVIGLQFHPESILTESGSQMLQNFFEIGQGE